MCGFKLWSILLVGSLLVSGTRGKLPDAPEFEKDLLIQRLNWMLWVIDECFRDLCYRTGICKGILEPAAIFHLKLPAINDTDHCGLIGFNETSCLKKLADGFFEFEVLFRFLTTEFGKSVINVDVMELLTKTLGWDIQEELTKLTKTHYSPPKFDRGLLGRLQGLKYWVRHFASFYVLSAMEKFAGQAVRVLNSIPDVTPDVYDK
uniref:Interleukin-6 n=1 Tax=Human herpesvirus 8 TaxID=37296 RepID=A0A386AV19_HHV8|nr:interleukin-6 [Human gammaherpesvirus 8]